MTGRVSVVIPTRNRSTMLMRLLTQLVNMIGGDLNEVIVVDNASTDDTREKIKEFPQINYIRNDVNRMSAPARQQGWDAATSKYVCFIDDDNVIENDTLSNLAEFMDANQDVGLCGPIQRRLSDGTIWCAGGRISQFLIVSYDREVDISKHKVLVDFQPNVFMVRSDLRDVGVHFDWQRFPHNWSEAEFGNQIRSVGSTVATCTKSTVFHDIDYSGYFTRINPTNIFDQAQSRIMYRRVHANKLLTWLVFLVAILPLSTLLLVVVARKRPDRRLLLRRYVEGTLCGLVSTLQRP